MTIADPSTGGKDADNSAEGWTAAHPARPPGTRPTDARPARPPGTRPTDAYPARPPGTRPTDAHLQAGSAI